MELQPLSHLEKLSDTEITPRDSAGKTKIQVFTTFVLMNIFVNYDTGVIPASLSIIHKELGTNFQETAAIGSIVYIGLCIASLFVSSFFYKWSAKRVLLISMLINCISCLCFASAHNLILIYLFRLIMGFSQAFCVIYSPVWTNEFAPRSQSTRWIGLLQVAVPFGISLGYLTASLFIHLDLNWRYSIMLQALFQFPLVISMYTISPEYLDTLHNHEPTENLDLNALKSLTQHLKLLAGNLTYVFLTLGLSSMIFVANGIQYWVSLYMLEVLKAGKLEVTLGFVLISTTAPIAGVLFGGMVSDYYGGYKGDNVKVAMKQGLFFAFFAFLAAGPAGFVRIVLWDFAFLWLLIFFGACIMPSAMGITVDSLPKELQSSGSALTQFMFNFGGFFLSPLASAVFMDSFGDRELALTWGFRFTLSFSIGALSFVIAAYISVHKMQENKNKLVF